MNPIRQKLLYEITNKTPWPKAAEIICQGADEIARLERDRDEWRRLAIAANMTAQDLATAVPPNTIIKSPNPI